MCYRRMFVRKQLAEQMQTCGLGRESNANGIWDGSEIKCKGDEMEMEFRYLFCSFSVLLIREA